MEYWTFFNNTTNVCIAVFKTDSKLLLPNEEVILENGKDNFLGWWKVKNKKIINTKNKNYEKTTINITDTYIQLFASKTEFRNQCRRKYIPR